MAKTNKPAARHPESDTRPALGDHIVPQFRLPEEEFQAFRNLSEKEFYSSFVEYLRAAIRFVNANGGIPRK